MSLKNKDSDHTNVSVEVLVFIYAQGIGVNLKEIIIHQPAQLPAWTSDNTTRTKPAMQTTKPMIFLNLYFVFKKIHVKSMTHGMDQQSSSITLVSDVY